MSSGPIASATVKVNPDTSTFQRDLQTAVNRAIRNLKVPPVNVPVSGGAAGSASAATTQAVRVGSASSKAAKGVNELSRSSQALRGSIIGLSRVTPVTVFGLGIYGTAAIAAGYAIKGAINSTAEFEHQLNVFQATTGATAEQMDLVSKTAKDLGADLTLPATSAGDAARAMTELAKAGLDVRQTIAGSRGVLQLAAAAQLDVGDAATFVATELNAFGLSGDKATHVADLLAGASIAAQGDIRDFATAFQQVSAVSRQVGLNLETTTGALTELAKAGLKGADGGTSLRTTLLRLAPTTKQAAEYQKALGIQIDKNRTIGAQLPELLDQYKLALTALTPVQQQQALAQIFGQDAIRAASILIRGGSEALRENTKEANRNGAANVLAQANAKGLSGAFSGLKSNLDTLGITLGEFVTGPLEGMVRGLSVAVGGANTLAESLGGLNKEINDFLTAGLPDSVKDGSFFFKGLPKGTQGATADVIKKYLKFQALGPVAFALSELGGGGSDVPDLRSGELEQYLADLNQTGRPDPGLRRDRGRPFEPTLSDAQKKKIRDAIAAREADKKKRKPLPADVTAPNKLEIAQLNAQLNDNLQAELAADKAIESYFHKRLGLAKKGTDRYREILAAETAAHAAVAGVQGQINSIADAARAAAKTARAAAKAKRDQDARDREQEIRDAAEQAKALFNLEKSRFDLKISAAGLTEGIGDDVRANRAEIRFFNRQIKRIEAIKKRRKLTIEEQQAVVDYKSAIINLRSTIQGLKADEGGKGFTLRELFQEAADEFTTFGSNIATPGGILSGQDARASFAQTVLGNLPGGGSSPADKLAPIANEQLSQAQQQTAYLSQIAAAVSHGGPGRGKIPAPVTGNRGRVGSLEAINAVQAASIWGLY